MRRLCVLALLLAILGGSASAHAAGPDAHAKALAQFQRDLVNVLALRAEAQPLLGAALLARPLPGLPDAISYHRLLERAAAAGDASPAVTWAQLADCDAAALACPNPEALQKLERQVPGNAAVWLLALGQATRDNDDDRARAALAKAAAADSYDDYRGASLQALAMAVTALPPPPTTFGTDDTMASSAAGVRAMIVFGVGGLQPLPGFQTAAQYCREGKEDAAIRDQCLALGKTLEWGSGALARSLGLHLRETLSPDDSERRDAADARRDLIWQVHSFTRLNARSQRDPDIARRLLKLARSGGTGMSLMLAALRASGIPVHAPADWKPHDDD